METLQTFSISPKKIVNVPNTNAVRRGECEAEGRRDGRNISFNFYFHVIKWRFFLTALNFKLIFFLPSLAEN